MPLRTCFCAFEKRGTVFEAASLALKKPPAGSSSEYKGFVSTRKKITRYFLHALPDTKIFLYNLNNE